MVIVCTTRLNIKKKKTVSLTDCRYVLVWLLEQTAINYLYGICLIETETECLLRGTN